MNTQLLWKFVGGAVSSGITAGIAFLVTKCSVGTVQDLLMALGLAVAGGAFHYVKNKYANE